MNENDDLEYNDGLGDLLREKERREFSWTKTTVTLAGLIFLVFIAFTFLFNYGKSVLDTQNTPAKKQVVKAKPSAPKATPKKVAQKTKTYEETLKKIETENLELLATIEKETPAPVKKAKETARKTVAKKSSADRTWPKPSKKVASKATPAPSAKKAPSKKVVSKKKQYYKVITGTYQNASNAKTQLAKLKKHGIDSFIKKKVIKNKLYHMIQSGAYIDKKDAQNLKTILKKKGVDSYIIKE